MKHRKWLLLILGVAVLLVMVWIGLGSAMPAHAASTIRVAIKPLKPFVLRNAEGSTPQFNGFSIDLWQAIAQRNNWQTEFVWHETVQEVLTAVQAGQADVGIAGISITKAREALLDFSHPMFNAGLQIMVPDKAEMSWSDYLASIFNVGLLRIFGVMVGAMLVAGHVIWLVERQKNADFPHGYLRGVWEGIWWAAVTVATVGYGDRTPRGVGGRLFAMIWMFTGIILVANFTASVTSHLTLQELRGTISGLEDLPGRRVVSVAGTTASSFLSTRAIHHVEVRDIEMAYQLLESGQADAVVYDAPVLLYYAAREGQGKVRMVGNLLSPEEYGIAMPTSSPLREAVNQSLLELRADGTYQQLYEKWFGR